MNKKKYLIIALISASIICCHTEKIVSANAVINFPVFTGTPSCQYDNYLQSYFNCLTANFASNVEGSCGYVAMEMALMYFNAYLNNDIVPSSYEHFTPTTINDMSLYANSPGSLDDRNYLNQNGYSSYLDYYNNHILNHVNDSLHAKLCSIAEENNLGYTFFNNFGLEASHIVDILNSYFDEIGYVEDDDYNVYSSYFSSGNQTNCRNIIKEIIDEGYPAILLVKENGHPFTGHFVVAYDYDSTLDKIYCHYGYHNNLYIHKDYLDEYDYASNVISFSFNNTHHEHSNQYKIYDGAGVIHNLCYDSPHIYTYNHVHSNDYRYAYLNQTKHKAICQCESNFVLKNHVVDINATGQFADCLFCGAAIDIWNYPIIGQSNELLYSVNGSILLPNGIIKLNMLDYDNYINDTLVFGNNVIE